VRVDFSYSSRDELTGITRYNDLTTTTAVYAFDDASRVTAITNKNGSSATISYYDYSYDAASRVTQQVYWSQVGTTTYTGTVPYQYDCADQLTYDGTQSYTYDANGNRTMSGYQTGTGNRLSSDGTWTYSYDNEGNLTQKTKGAGLETWYYTYDN